MALRFADRVLETSTTTGTGAYTLAGAQPNYIPFSSIPSIQNNDTVYYAAVDSLGAGWEVGIGTYGISTTLTRTTILASSNSGAAVSWGAGTRNIFCTLASSYLTGKANLAGAAFTGGVYTASQTPAFSATPTFDASTSNVFEPGTMTASITSMTIINQGAGQTISIRLQQDATGGRTVTIPSGAVVAGSVNTAANKVSWLTITYSGRSSVWEGTWTQLP